MGGPPNLVLVIIRCWLSQIVRKATRRDVLKAAHQIPRHGENASTGLLVVPWRRRHYDPPKRLNSPTGLLISCKKHSVYLDANSFSAGQEIFRP